ncbi:MAG: hypothetical protein AAF518_25140 [Spirochaetota bacterium]
MSKTPKHILERILEVQENKSFHLNLSDENLTEIPEEVFTLSWLEDLYLDSNQLKDIPDNITKLYKLKSEGLQRISYFGD